MTSVHSALESLQLQKQRHLGEISVIRHKQHCEEMKKTMLPTSRSPSQPEMGPVNLNMPNGKQGTIDEVDGQLSVYRTMEECDSLLTFLRNRAAGHNGENTTYSEIANQKPSPIGTKNPKDDKTIIEELRMHNEALRAHILDLLRENEGYYKELQILRKENVEFHISQSGKNKQQSPGVHSSSMLADSTDSDKSEKYYPNPNRLDINDIPSMELPPLEMPTFDFDSLGKLSDSQ